jgi:hypothetical protein
MVDNFLIGFSKKLGLRSYRCTTFKSVQLYTNSDDILATDTYLVIFQLCNTFFVSYEFCVPTKT